MLPLLKGLFLQESSLHQLLHRLPRIPTFLCLLRVKGTANRVTGVKGHVPCGPRDKFSILSSIRRPNRLLRYSISGWDQLPILLVHEMTTYSTTAVLDLRMGNSPYFSRPQDGSQGRDKISTSTQDGQSRKVLTKRTYQLIDQKSYIYMAKRRYSTSY